MGLIYDKVRGRPSEEMIMTCCRNFKLRVWR